MNLTDKDKSRYSRHLLLKEVGVDGQEKLKSARVLVIGAGGLGCPILSYLCAAGVGYLGVVDFDIVDESNLQRQVLFCVDDIGLSKSIQAKIKLERQNPLIEIQAFNERLTPKNALNLFKQFDIIVDGTDNFATRYMVNDACVLANKPLVYGSIHKFEGQVSVFNYKNGPTYRCVFPVPPNPGSVPNCSEVGVIGVLPGIIGTQQANEAIKIILGIGEVLSGKILMYNALQAEFNRFSVNKSKHINSPQSVEEFEDFDYEFFCGLKEENVVASISRTEFEEIMHSDFVVDVRESWEHPQLTTENILNAPLDDLEDFVDQIPRDQTVYVVCQKGGRSAAAIEVLSREYNFTNLINVEGGLIG
jgi:adenylyltransferase/sulfurtransferase